jgi:hypothetical protein
MIRRLADALGIGALAAACYALYLITSALVEALR